MSINLASSLSAVTTDSNTGVTHLVWADNGSIWHAIYNANSETWEEAEEIAFIGTEPVSSLNLVANRNLIDGSNPGLVVVWQQGSLNRSDLYYTAAQYNQNQDLVWLPSPQALTSDQVGDLEPAITVVNSIQGGIKEASVIVVGSKVNFENAANQSIREDTDFYSQSFSISSRQFTAQANGLIPSAEYTPQLNRDGLVNLGVLANKEQANNPTGGNSKTVQAGTTEITSAPTEQPNQQPVGAFNSQTYFKSNLLKDWELIGSVPKNVFLRALIEPIMSRIELVGTLSGGSTLPLSDGQLLFIETRALVEWRTLFGTQNPWSANQKHNTLAKLAKKGLEAATNKLLRGTNKSPVTFGFYLDTNYRFVPTCPNELANIADLLSLTASVKLPIIPSAETAGFFTSDVNGSIGLSFNMFASPYSASGTYFPQTINAVNASVASKSLQDVEILAQAITSGGTDGINALVAEIALNLGQTLAAFINGTAEGLGMSGTISFPVLATNVQGKLQLPHVPIVSAQASGGVRTAINWGVGDTDSSIFLSFPFGIDFRLGPLKTGFNFSPGWAWDIHAGNQSEKRGILTASGQGGTSEDSFVPSAAPATASFAGSLLNLNFGTAVAQLPAASDFTVVVTDYAGKQQTIPVFNIVGGATTNSVVLQLESPIPITENYDYTSSTNPSPTSDQVTIDYTNSNDTLDQDGNPLPGLTGLKVTNETPTTLVYSYDPISGNSQNYINPTLLLTFNTPLNTDVMPEASRFSVASGTQTLIPNKAEVTAEGVFLIFSPSVSNLSLQNVIVKYDSGNTAAGNTLVDTNGNQIPSFTVQSGLSVQVSQSYVAITNTNPNLTLSSSPTDYQVQIVSADGSSQIVSVEQVIIRGTNAILGLSTNAQPDQIVNISFSSISQNYLLSSLVEAVSPPSISTKSLQSTIEADLGQDTSPVIIQPGLSNPILAWISDAPSLEPIAGLVSDKTIRLSFIEELGNGSAVPDSSQFTVTDSLQKTYGVNNISVNGNTLILSLDNEVDPTAVINVSYSLSSEGPNLFLDNGATQTQLWISSFTNFSLINNGIPEDKPSVMNGSSVVLTASTNLIVLVLDMSLRYNGGTNSEFTVYSNGVQFSVKNVTITENSILLTVEPPEGINLIGAGDVVLVSYSGTSVTSTTGKKVEFTNQVVTTTASQPTTIIKYAVVDPASVNLVKTISSIPNSSGLNFDPAGAFSSKPKNGLEIGVLIWTNASSNEIKTNLTPGEFYTANETTIINESFNEANIYYSFYNPSTKTWSLASVLADQAGSEGSLTIAALESGDFMAAWINYNNSKSTVFAATLSFDPNSQNWTWGTPQSISSTANPDPLTELKIVSINGNPTVLWTETQASSYTELTENESPLIYFRLAESSGSTLRNEGIYGAGGNGTYSGAVSFKQLGALESPLTNVGDPNPAVLFQSRSSAKSSIIPLNSNSLSLEFWFKISGLPEPNEQINLVSVGGVVEVSVNEGGLNLDFNGKTLSSVDFTPSTNEWIYVVTTYDGIANQASLYINGKLSSSLESLDNALPASTTLNLASEQNTTAVFLDEVALYRKAWAYEDLTEITKMTDWNTLSQSQITQILFSNNPIGNKFNSRYTPPLPPGPNTKVLTSISNQWAADASTITPLAKPNQTQLSNTNQPAWDVASYARANPSGRVFPNGVPDILLPFNLSNQLTSIDITSMVVTAKNINNETITWSLGQTNSAGIQLGLVQENKLLNTRNSNSTKPFTYKVLSPDIDLELLIDPGMNTFANTTQFQVTTTFSTGGTNTQLVRPVNSIVEYSSLSNSSVSGTATVTEANDSSLALIDSGFIINTNNPAIGYAIVSANFNNDKKSDVAVANRGFTSSDGTKVPGSIQVLFGGGSVLSNAESMPLTPTDLSGNPNGILITGIKDSGECNGDLPISMATGDINGDGIAELVIGDPNANSVYIVFISNLTAGQIIDVTNMTSHQGYTIGGEQGSSFGFSVAVGNFNSQAAKSATAATEGNGDVVIGAPGWNNGDGAVYVAFDGDSEISLIYSSSKSNEQAGFRVAVSSVQSSGTTFTGNTLSDDLIIGAVGYKSTVTNQWVGLDGLPASANSNPNRPAYPLTSTTESGAVYVWASDGTEALSEYAIYIGSNLPSNNGTANNVNLGSALYSGDLDGDAVNDLAMAAPGDSDDSGVIYVLAGNISKNSKAQNILDVANLSIVGGLPFSQTGTVLTSPGDLNDDRYPDLLITAPNGANGTGQSYVIFNPLDLSRTGHVLDLNVTANTSQGTFLLNGSLPYELAGMAGSGIGDINFDGVDDMILSAPNAGQLYAIYGHPWLADDGSIKLANISGNNGFVIDGNLYSVNGVPLIGTGNNVVMLGDANGDGFDDLLSAGSGNGAVLTFGASTAALLDAATGTNQLILSIAGGGSISRIISAGDFNGDGLADFGVVDKLHNFYLVMGNSTLGPQETLILDSTMATAINITSADALGDYNGDGFDDLVLETTDQAKPIILGNRKGSFNRSSLISDNNSAFGALGDINGDGFGDFGGGAPAGNGAASIYLGNPGAKSNQAVAISPPTAFISSQVQTASGTWNIEVNGKQSTKFNGAPSMTLFNDRLYMAYTGVAGSSTYNGSPFIQWSPDGVNWNGNTNFQTPLGQSSTGVTITSFHGRLYAAWINPSEELIIASAESVPLNESPSGLVWSNPINTGQKGSYVSPAMSVLDGVLYVFFASGGQNASIFEYISSQDGINWTLSPSSLPLPYGFLPLGASLAVTADNTNIYLSYAKATGNNHASASNQVLATFDGKDWSNEVFGPAPLRGSGLISLGETLQNFYLPDSRSMNLMSLPANGVWSEPANLNDISYDTLDNWLTYPNPTLFQEKLFVGYGNQLTSGPLVYVSYANTKDHVFQPNQTQQFGQGFTNIGDFNGDGIADFSILAPGFFSNMGVTNNNTYENNQGAILIYYGTVNGVNSSMQPDVVLGTPKATGTTNLVNHQAMLLTQMAAAGDVNADGYDDLLIASPTTALTNQNTADGVAFIIFGGGDALWGQKYPATSPFDTGTLTSSTSQLTLYFSRSLNPSFIPNTNAFTVQSDFTTIKVAGVTLSSDNPTRLTLDLEAAADTSGFLSVSYQLPTSGAALTYASGTRVSAFVSSNDPSIASLGAPAIELNSSAQYGFQIAGLPSSLAGISLDGRGDVNGDGFSDFLIGAPGGDINLAYTLFGSDFNNTVNQTGTIGNDVMIGTPTGESFVAGQGNDGIYSGGGNDIVYAGPGDDYLSANDTYFQRLDGGAGLDVLALQGYNGQAWDITTLSPGVRLQNIEFLVTEGYGANPLTLNPVTVNALSPTNTLTVIMDDQDTLILNGDFGYTGQTYQYNQNFRVYQSAATAATVLLNDAHTSVFINKNAPNINYPAAILPAATTAANTDALPPAARVSLDGEQSPIAANSQATEETSTTITVSNATITEQSGPAEFTVYRTGDMNHYVWVSYYTKDGDGKAGDRYIPVAGQLFFAPGESSKTVTVPIPNNNKYVGSRQFELVVTFEGETTDATLVPDAWHAAVTTPKEQVRRWSANSDMENGNTISFNVTSSRSAHQVVTLDLDLNGTVTPQVWNPTSQRFQTIPIDASNGLVQMQDLNADMIGDLYRLKFEDGGPFDGDKLVNGLVNLTFDLAELKVTSIPDNGGRTQGTDGPDYMNASNSISTNRLEGLAGNDVLIGSQQRDILIGGDGNDSLFGGGGVDQLYGDTGDDILDGGAAMNFLYGGDGGDNFMLRSGQGPQRVMDFNSTAGDQFLLDNLTFEQLSFHGNQIQLGMETLALVVDQMGKPVFDFATNRGWFNEIQTG